MGNGLDRSAKKISAAFFGDELQIYLTGGEIGGAGEFNVDEPFVVAQIQVSLSTVNSNENFAVLVGRHCTGVHIEVGVKLYDGDG